MGYRRDVVDEEKSKGNKIFKQQETIVSSADKKALFYEKKKANLITLQRTVKLFEMAVDGATNTTTTSNIGTVTPAVTVTAPPSD